MKQKLLFSLILTFIFTLTSLGQSDCDEKFSSDDVLRWRKQIEFSPKYNSLNTFDYVISKLSDKAYFQFHIEVTVSCDDLPRKKNTIQNMYYFWDKKVTLSKLEQYYPAYYVFYKIDKMGMENR